MLLRTLGSVDKAWTDPTSGRGLRSSILKVTLPARQQFDPTFALVR